MSRFRVGLRLVRDVESGCWVTLDGGRVVSIVRGHYDTDEVIGMFLDLAEDQAGEDEAVLLARTDAGYAAIVADLAVRPS